MLRMSGATEQHLFQNRCPAAGSFTGRQPDIYKEKVPFLETDFRPGKIASWQSGTVNV